MKLLVFTTKRELRSFASSHTDTLLPKLLTIGDFLDRVILTDKTFIAPEQRYYYLHRACEGVDLVSLGIDSSFERFLSESETIYALFKEMKLEGVEFSDLDRSDTYAHYHEHLEILEQIYHNYKELLERNNLVDIVTLQDFSINSDYFGQFSHIEIFLSGYLSKFDREIIRSIPTPITIHFSVSRFNKELAQKMFGEIEEGLYEITPERDGWHKKKLAVKLQKPHYEISSFTKRIEQANFVFAKIEEFVHSGIPPHNIVVIVPNVDFKEYLEAFDYYDNLNFSMGESFIYSPLYLLLEAWYRYSFLDEEEYGKKLDEETLAKLGQIKNWNDLKAFVIEQASAKEMQIIQEEIFLFEKIIDGLQLPLKKILGLLLERLRKCSFDDVRGGKITVMEVLESRGCRFDGVIVVDFNEGVVPRILGEDLFLDTKVRKQANLPTKAQKESLQKHYYYTLFQKAKRVAISYVEDEEQSPSRFLYELGCKKPQKDGFYKEVLYTLQPAVAFTHIHERFAKPTKLSPTSLEILLKCPLRYYLQYEKNIKSESQEYFGTLIHSAINSAIKSSPKSAKEYYEAIMEHLLSKLSKLERYRMLVEWEPRLIQFAKKDFDLLQGEILFEAKAQRVLDGFMLEARADRIIRKSGKIYIYDYKTNNTSDYLKSYLKEEVKLQAEFYSYIWQSDEVYFWDLKNVRLQKVDTKEAKAKIQEALGKIETTTKMSDDSSYCRFCPYRFGCKGEA